MRKLSFFSALMMVAGMGAAVIPHAQARPAVVQPVQIDLSAFRITTDKEGKESAVEAQQAKPGDTIEYRATYRNVSSSRIAGLKATLPIPADMSFTGASIPTGAEASTDGKTFAGMPLRKKVGDKLVDVPYSDYRALRWKVAELLPNQSVIVRARAKVNTTTP